MKKIFVITSLFTVGVIFCAHAQEQKTNRQFADQLFNRFEYYNASLVYHKLAKKHKSDVYALEQLGACYRLMNNDEAAEKWYGLAIAQPKAQPLDYYYFAESLQKNQKFAEAKVQYEMYAQKMNGQVSVAKNLASCDSATLWMSQPSMMKVDNVQTLNTKLSDWGLNYYGKSGLVFVSEKNTINHPIVNDEYRWTGNPWLKLFLASNEEKLGEELMIVRTQGDNFKPDYHVGPMVLNATEDTAFVTITTRVFSSGLATEKIAKEKMYTRRLQLFEAYKKEGRWAILKSFAYNNLDQYSVGHATLSNNGKLLYFTSDMPGGEGKTDIWFCEKMANGSWGQPINCGKSINTAEEEAFPCISDNGELYYSSKGKFGMGGFDVFKATGEKINWSEPVNLKYPINTSRDDFSLATRDGKNGYLSSNRMGGAGSDDIYRFVDTTPPPVVTPPVQPVNPVVTVSPTRPKGSWILRNIYYDFDKSNIRPDAAVELDKLIKILNQFPDLKIELSSHTDSRGSDIYNEALSQRRAVSAVGYLIERGIAKDRVRAKGYGEKRLVNECSNGVYCSVPKHQENRRTEVKVLN